MLRLPLILSISLSVYVSAYHWLSPSLCLPLLEACAATPINWADPLKEQVSANGAQRVSKVASAPTRPTNDVCKTKVATRTTNGDEKWMCPLKQDGGPRRHALALCPPKLLFGPLPSLLADQCCQVLDGILVPLEMLARLAGGGAARGLRNRWEQKRLDRARR